MTLKFASRWTVLTVLPIASLVGGRAMAKAPVRIACVGDSITWGVGLANRNTQAYAALLQKKLGKSYQVGNFGQGWATALKHPTAPTLSYWSAPPFKRALAFRPNIVILMLGTNDSNPLNRAHVKKHFIHDYTALVRRFEKLPTHPRVFVCLPPSLEDGSVKGPNQALPLHGVIPRILRVAKAMHLAEVNIFHALAGHWKLFTGDRIHPNTQGQKVMARLMYTVLLKNKAVINDQ